MILEIASSKNDYLSPGMSSNLAWCIAHDDAGLYIKTFLFSSSLSPRPSEFFLFFCVSKWLLFFLKKKKVNAKGPNDGLLLLCDFFIVFSDILCIWVSIQLACELPPSPELIHLFTRAVKICIIRPRRTSRRRREPSSRVGDGSCINPIAFQ